MDSGQGGIYRRPRSASSIVMAVIVLGLAGCRTDASAAVARPPSPPPFSVAVRAERGVTTALAAEIDSRLKGLHRSVGHDFGIYPSHLMVELFATHPSFTHALWAQQRQRPQTTTDDSSSIVRNTLLLGPLPASYLWHNLAHVYTEWIIDQLAHNSSDALPSDPWLYDGLAEYEAYRYAPGGLVCKGGPSPVLDVTRIHTARQWLALRAGPLGSLVYCLSYLRVHSLVAHAGWRCIISALHDSRGWAAAASRLMIVDRRGKCS
jgi:hypothetical protein